VRSEIIEGNGRKKRRSNKKYQISSTSENIFDYWTSRVEKIAIHNDMKDITMNKLEEYYLLPE